MLQRKKRHKFPPKKALKVYHKEERRAQHNFWTVGTIERQSAQLKLEQQVQSIGTTHYTRPTLQTTVYNTTAAWPIWTHYLHSVFYYFMRQRDAPIQESVSTDSLNEVWSGARQSNYIYSSNCDTITTIKNSWFEYFLETLSLAKLTVLYNSRCSTIMH